ncbi:urease accessory protein ureD [Paenibacillus darwinianus]|uniref:Urease accessory protein UreD n=1 Tax=Paenibacillus darwinianus TaxID=1380763 RepID=A0A9W5RZI5_9BACL|nr:urease accessory protein UreD [Paenibacillus darwinianus]EXX84842.1 urease accessory protein ureD [Paenibacillus darwinianus]EXX85465.1 urease accessory protein ureD [Paenibacillus darwinianus]EXX85656.1 urease accessory protein ureD [Paenibacillus darwinianus]
MPAAFRIPTDGKERDGSRTSVLRASFALRSGRTILEGKYQTAPVKIAKTFDTPHELAAIVMDASPGMLAGDRYVFEWSLEAGTRLYVTNQSYTKVHPCSAGIGAEMAQRFVVGDGACAQSMMQPVMLYKDADFRSATEVELGRGAVWMQAEVLCPGRLLRGESFLYRRLDNRLTVLYGGEPIFHSRQLVLPAEQRLAAAGAWEDMTHAGTFYAFSDRISSVQLDAVRAALESGGPTDPATVIAGVSLTYRHGLAVVAAGRTAWQLQRTLHAAWSAVRESLDGLPPFVLCQT